MMKCLWIYCIILVLASAKAQQVVSSTKIEIQNNQASFSCYDPAVADRYDDFYVQVYFKSLNDQAAADVMIARYQVRTQKLNNYKQQFGGRVSFSSVGDIVIDNLQLIDEGTYRCEPQAFDMSPAENRVLQTELTVYVAPRVKAVKVQDPLVAGADFEKAATCIAESGKPAATVRWTYDRHLQYNQTNDRTAASRLTETVTADLHLAPTKFYNKETFTCEISHPAFTETRYLTIVLNVTYPPEVPMVTANTEKTEITCEADGNPLPSIQWTMPDGQRITGQSTVQIVTPAKSNNDTYLCTASNGLSPQAVKSITYGQLITMPIPQVEEANVGAIVGGIIGGLLLLFLIITLVYFFLLKPSRDRDPGPYKPATRGPLLLNSSTTERNSSRPQIQHANNALNTSRNRPPSPDRPPPNDDEFGGGDDKMELVNDEISSAESSDSDDGRHDVDLEVNALNPVVNPAQFDQQPQSRSAVNFQARRKRPSTSPGQRNSMRSRSRDDLTSSQHPSRTHTPSPAPRQPPKYDPNEERGYPQSDTAPLQYHEMQEEKYQQQRYQQPQYVDYPKGHQPPPSNGDTLPPYEREPVQYSEVDHSNYKQHAPRRVNKPFEEPVEYAQIRHSGYSHVV